MTNSELGQLVLRIRDGDASAFDDLYTATQKAVYYHAYQILKNEDDALDAVQDTYVTAFRTLDDLKAPEAVASWLNTTVTHICLNKIRGSKKDIYSLDDEDFIYEPEAPTEEQPENIVEKDSTSEILASFIDKLPDAQKATVIYYYYDNMSVKDIAEEMGCSENTVKSRLNYARKALEGNIAEEEKRSGIRLHSVTPLSIFAAVRYLIQAAATPEKGLAAVGASVAAAGATAAVAGGAGGAAASVAAVGAAAAGAAAAGTAATSGVVAAVVGTVGGKVAIGLATAAVAAGVIIGAPKTNVEQVPEEPAAIVETLTEEAAETEEVPEIEEEAAAPAEIDVEAGDAEEEKTEEEIIEEPEEEPEAGPEDEPEDSAEPSGATGDTAPTALSEPAGGEDKTTTSADPSVTEEITEPPRVVALSGGNGSGGNGKTAVEGGKVGGAGSGATAQSGGGWTGGGGGGGGGRG